jgi:hypothetical protein
MPTYNYEDIEDLAKSSPSIPPSLRAKSDVNGPCTEAWNRNWDLIIRLYVSLDWPLKDVIPYMATEYGFDAS